MLPKIYLLSKTIHRLAMWLMLVMGSGMTLGGLILHRSLEREWLPAFIDPQLVRFWHNQMAVPFAGVMLLMMGTGVLLWGIPLLLKRRA